MLQRFHDLDQAYIYLIGVLRLMNASKKILLSKDDALISAIDTWSCTYRLLELDIYGCISDVRTHGAFAIIVHQYNPHTGTLNDVEHWASLGLFTVIIGAPTCKADLWVTEIMGQYNYAVVSDLFTIRPRPPPGEFSIKSKPPPGIFTIRLRPPPGNMRSLLIRVLRRLYVVKTHADCINEAVPRGAVLVFGVDNDRFQHPTTLTVMVWQSLRVRTPIHHLGAQYASASFSGDVKAFLRQIAMLHAVAMNRVCQ
jgi:hypothetical protein